MSGLGLLATALAGGAGVIGKQAGDDIEAGRKADLMKQEAEIKAQFEERLMERRAVVARQSNKDILGDNLAFEGSEGTMAARDRIARAAGATSRGVLLESLNDTTLTEAQRKKARDDALAAGDTAAEVTKKQAGDKDYVASIGVLELAKPQVRAQIAASMASAGASAASAKESAMRLKQLGEVGEMATQVRGLQTKLAGAKTDEERSAIQQQITDLGFSGKDTKGFLSIAERAITNGDAALKVLNNPDADPAAKDAARTQLERANEFAEKAAAQAGIKINGPAKPSQQQAHAEAEAAIKQGVSREAINERLTKLGYQPLGGATKPGMVPGAERAVSAKPEPVYRKADSGRIVDVTTGRTLTPEQSAIYEKMQRGEPTTPRERELLKD